MDARTDADRIEDLKRQRDEIETRTGAVAAREARELDREISTLERLHR